MKVAEAGVITAGSSIQTKFSLLISEARVALDQRLKHGHLAFQEIIPHRRSSHFTFHRGSACTRGSSFGISHCGSALPPGQLQEAALGSLPSPSYRDDFRKNIISRSLEMLSFHARGLSSIFTASLAVMHNCFWLLFRQLNRRLKSLLQAGFRSYVKILHSIANVNFSFSL